LAGYADVETLMRRSELISLQLVDRATGADGFGTDIRESF
jgi:hypothetical protein